MALIVPKVHRGKRSMSWGRTFLTVSVATFALCCALAGFRPADAQTNPPHAPDYSAWAANTSRLLNLDSVQQSAFQDYLAAVSSDSTKRPVMSEDQIYAMTTPDRLDFIYNRIGIDLSIARSQAETARRLYNLLSPEQRKVFDGATIPHRAHPHVAAGVASEPAPTEPIYEFPSHTNPSWFIRPSDDDITRVYPAVALQKRTTGVATMRCTVDVDGYLSNCTILNETPKDQGFGNAALEITAYMRMHPATNYGVPIPSIVTVPVGFGD
jgi:TonB family protein